VIQAQGQLGLDQEQQRIQRQKAYQEKLNTKKMAFDEAAYEKANTPKLHRRQGTRHGPDAPPFDEPTSAAEVTRGDTLNAMLPYLKALGDQGTPGSPQSLNPSVLAAIMSPRQTPAARHHRGRVKNGGKLACRSCSRGRCRRKLDSLLPKAVEQAAANTLEPATYTQVVGLVQSMQDDIKALSQGPNRGSSSSRASASRPARIVAESPCKIRTRRNTSPAGIAAAGGNVQELVN